MERRWKKKKKEEEIERTITKGSESESPWKRKKE